MCSFEISLTTFRGLLILLFCLNNANLRVLSVHYQTIWAMQCDRGKKQMKNWHACLLTHSNTKHLYPHPHQCKHTHPHTHTPTHPHTHTPTHPHTHTPTHTHTHTPSKSHDSLLGPTLGILFTNVLF
jgi:hypothetical protein